MKDADLKRIVQEVMREVAAAEGASVAGASAARVRSEIRSEPARRRGGRAVVTTTGKNQRGMVARIAQAIADAGGDIVDISQTLVSDYFTMIIVVDTGALTVSFADFKSRLEKAVAAQGAECLVMHEDVVNALQRV